MNEVLLLSMTIFMIFQLVGHKGETRRNYKTTTPSFPSVSLLAPVTPPTLNSTAKGLFWKEEENVSFRPD